MPNPLKASHKTCEELREALAAARALIEPPSERTGFEGVQGARVIPTPRTAHDAPEGIDERIRELEQALRDAGCDEE